MAEPTTPASWTTLAHLLRPQGRKGELLAELLTDFPERFRDTPRVFLAKPDFAGTEAQARPVHITNHWMPVGKNHGRIVLTFEGIDSISLAETLEGLEVIIPSTERMELDEDAEYIDDLLDCTVFNGAEPIGKVTAVDFPTTADGTRRLPDAAPLLTVLTPAGDEVLIPYVQAFIVSISTEAQRIEMNLPPGLLEINRGTSHEPEPEPEPEGAADDEDDDEDVPQDPTP